MTSSTREPIFAMKQKAKYATDDAIYELQGRLVKYVRLYRIGDEEVAVRILFDNIFRTLSAFVQDDIDRHDTLYDEQFWPSLHGRA